MDRLHLTILSIATMLMGKDEKNLTKSGWPIFLLQYLQ